MNDDFWEGKFAIVDGNVFELGYSTGNKPFLRTKNPQIVDRRFKQVEDVFVRQVKLSEVERVFNVTIEIVVGGDHFAVGGSSQDIVQIRTGTAEIAKKHSMELWDRGEWRKWISILEIDKVIRTEHPDSL